MEKPGTSRTHTLLVPKAEGPRRKWRRRAHVVGCRPRLFYRPLTPFLGVTQPRVIECIGPWYARPQSGSRSQGHRPTNACATSLRTNGRRRHRPSNRNNTYTVHAIHRPAVHVTTYGVYPVFYARPMVRPRNTYAIITTPCIPIIIVIVVIISIVATYVRFAM